MFDNLGRELKSLLFTALRTTSVCEERTVLTYTLQEKAECVPNCLHTRSNRSTVLRARMPYLDVRA